MQILIEIDDEVYKRFMDDYVGCPDIIYAVRKGIPLPKGHGDLKDVNDIWNNIPDVNVLTNHFTTYDIQHFIDDAPTIIDADRGEC